MHPSSLLKCTGVSSAKALSLSQNFATQVGLLSLLGKQLQVCGCLANLAKSASISRIMFTFILIGVGVVLSIIVVVGLVIFCCRKPSVTRVAFPVTICNDLLDVSVRLVLRMVPTLKNDFTRTPKRASSNDASSVNSSKWGKWRATRSFALIVAEFHPVEKLKRI